MTGGRQIINKNNISYYISTNEIWHTEDGEDWDPVVTPDHFALHNKLFNSRYGHTVSILLDKM